MKSPRELLLARHKHAEGELDDISQTITNEIGASKFFEPSWIATFRSALSPCPIAWGALAAAWLLIAALNVVSSDPTAKPVATAKRPPDVIEALREQKELLTELVEQHRSDAEPDRSRQRPRTERVQTVAIT